MGRGSAWGNSVSLDIHRLIGSLGEMVLSGGRGPLAEVVELYGVRYGVHGTGARIIGWIFDIATVMAGRCIRSILSGLGSREGDCAPVPTAHEATRNFNLLT